MIKLSVNVNKIATLRNSRGGIDPERDRRPSTSCLEAGAPGITVHPRADERHIRRTDVFEIAARLEARARDGRDVGVQHRRRSAAGRLIDLVLEVRPDQCTLVPVVPGEITSQAGWPPSASTSAASSAIVAAI